jgi:hypothetical protein
VKETSRVELAILIAVWLTFALDIFSTFTSSPQTTELNAGSRTPTLMKWVSIGAIVAVAGGVGGSIVSRKIWPVLITAGASLGMFLLYKHASQSGLESKQDNSTESY